MRAAEGEPEDVFWDALRSVLGRELVGRLRLDAMSRRGLDSVDLHVNEERVSIAESERLEILED